MTLREFAAVLAGAYPNCRHYTAGKQTGSYAVWREYGGRRQQGGPLLVRKIQVDLFTRKELDPALQDITDALDGAGVAFEAPKTTYEEDTGYIHHIILCEVVDRG